MSKATRKNGSGTPHLCERKIGYRVTYEGLIR